MAEATAKGWSPAAVRPCSVAARGCVCSSRGAELGQEPRVRATDSGAGREALSGGGREAWSVAGGFKTLLEEPGLTSGLGRTSLGGPALLFAQEEVREDEEAEEEEAEPP